MLNYAGFFIGASSRLLGTAQRGDIVIAMTDPPLIGVAVRLVVWARGGAARQLAPGRVPGDS